MLVTAILHASTEGDSRLKTLRIRFGDMEIFEDFLKMEDWDKEICKAGFKYIADYKAKYGIKVNIVPQYPDIINASKEEENRKKRKAEREQKEEENRKKKKNKKKPKGEGFGGDGRTMDGWGQMVEMMVEMMVPGHKVELIIGKGRQTIKMLQEQTGAKIVIIEESRKPTEQKPLRISGSPESVEEAKAKVMDILGQKKCFFREWKMKNGKWRVCDVYR